MTSIEQDLEDFLSLWFSPSQDLPTYTSGSTGSPSLIHIDKRNMLQSAAISVRYFNIQPQDTVWLCLPMHTIAARMLVLRSIVAKARLLCTRPQTNPFCDLPPSEGIDFVSLTPHQLSHIARSSEDWERLLQCKQVLLGGAPVPENLLARLQTAPNKIYLSYGMTETLSHVAIRKLSGVDASERFYTLPGYHVRQDSDCRAIIDLPWGQTIHSNDLIEQFPDKGFCIKGRVDNTINSGGVKLQIEAIEDLLSQHSSHAFCICPAPHLSLGQCVALLSPSDWDPQLLDEWLRPINPYYIPKLIIRSEVPLLSNGKIDRTRASALAENWYKEQCKK
ncbi:O-succinylbenzoic acid-CoA ligase [Porphyromonas crevioricanis JCM 13913]|nr:O-succinylbenzoic acid-CoA ligase [Porphyromonas crevioricanis JCM 13913]